MPATKGPTLSPCDACATTKKADALIASLVTRHRSSAQPEVAVARSPPAAMPWSSRFGARVLAGGHDDEPNSKLRLARWGSSVRAMSSERIWSRFSSARISTRIGSVTRVIYLHA